MSPDPQPGVFVTTRWTLVLRARGQEPEARAALAELCEAYWFPVFRFLRRDGRSEDEARELAQEFFTRLLSGAGLATVDPGRGRFRSYLLGAVKHFLADARDRAARLKRGGGVLPESLEARVEGGAGEEGASPGQEIEDPHGAFDATAFDREWAVAVMDRGLKALEQDYTRAGKADQFNVLRAWLAGEEPVASQAQAAAELGLSVGAVKVAVHRLRSRYRALLREELAQTLPEGGSVEEELEYLVRVLRRNA